LRDWYGLLFVFIAFTLIAAGGLVLLSMAETGEGRLSGYPLIGSGIFGMMATAWQAVRDLNKKSPGRDPGDRKRHEHTADSPGSGNLH
jgi:hypothetical protein